MNELQKISLHRGLRMLGNRTAEPWSKVNNKLHALMLSAIRDRSDSPDLIAVRFTGINLNIYHCAE